jgi:hypothetical protein
MLIPKDQPYLLRLNSYYLHFEKFIEHLQGDIGSGCLYCQAADREILVYFDEQEVIRGIIQQSGQDAQDSQELDSILQLLSTENFQVTVYHLNAASIFYWSEIPPFRRNRTKIDTTKFTLSDLAIRLQEISFSGFIDIDMGADNPAAILFFHKGKRLGGSYSWAKGGLSSSDEDYNRLLFVVDTAEAATFSMGNFLSKAETTPEEETDNNLDDSQYFSDLETAVKEFLAIYLTVVKRKIKTNPIVTLKQEFLEHLDEFPSLDLFKPMFQLSDTGVIEFTDDARRKEIAKGIVTCTWNVIEANKLTKKFRNAIHKWDYRIALEERGIEVLP